ncbi:hypothetical protein like AT4G16640 [Hibiscus trionum]|uniref:Peptidase metallopeptidase domain-containing protein n=1 Tax=Hibiscus trionum TaxID=183268 RepID=A0A9W7J059_HIBTR|nr:hypothetical protein like AT4G16640 [Hibiscus trionum]
MAVKLSHLFFGVFLMFFVLQPFMVKSSILKLESLGNLEQAQKGDNVYGLGKVKQFLHTLGYYPSENEVLDDEFDDALESALEAFQGFYNLKITGKVDPDTIKAMETPRCGIPDIVRRQSYNDTKETHGHNHGMSHLVSNYKFFNGTPRWNKAQLTYSFIQSPYYRASLQVMQYVMAQAFKTWEGVSPFRFTEASQLGNRADIKITFDKIDGFGNFLAYAYAPGNGWLYFDEAEHWTTNPTARDQTDLQSVAVHEIGHNMGLDHSQDPNAIMYPQYPPGSIKRNLGADDVQGLRVLYNY